MKKIFQRKVSVIILILLIAVSGIILPRELNDLDEIWNYNFARCIADGLLPYKDFNMVQTPLLPIICGIILKITFNELIVMRILAIVSMTAIFFTTYKIFERLVIQRLIIILFLIEFYSLFYKYFCIDYNYAVLLITLITIYIELKKELLEVNFKRDLLLGVLVGTSILFKQTTGLALIIVYVFYKSLLVSNKEEFKKVVLIILHRFLGILLPVCIFALYLTINNIWNDFIDYTILSINTFSNKISYIKLINGNYGMAMQILSILVPATIIFMYYISVWKKNNSKEQKNLFVLFCYSVASTVLIYPISDSIHFLIGTMPTIVALCYLIYLLLKNNELIKKVEIKYMIKTFVIFYIMTIMFVSSFRIINYIITAKSFNEYNHFKFIPCFNDDIKNIDNYIINKNIEGKKVYILDAASAIYMIPIDRYNKDYDLFLKGNIGAKGEEGLIDKIEKEGNNTIVLILNDNYIRNWQTPENVIDYIKENWHKQDEISVFDVYYKI